MRRVQWDLIDEVPSLDLAVNVSIDLTDLMDRGKNVSFLYQKDDKAKIDTTKKDVPKGLSHQKVTCLSETLPNPDCKSTEDTKFKKKFHAGWFQGEVILIDTQTDHPKNRRMPNNDHNMEW
ncbi:hypothetical protein HJC23_004730 [Cyclotella cryptica]|uniref:Uncharacterized protein n=1 Tax=Cyclotella cryptica TaxID=29204 RepID=A0ABD3NFT8_9STRA